ncbi:MAG: GEVED domain-containing protein, partial [Bacteroidota bacterium]
MTLTRLLAAVLSLLLAWVVSAPTTATAASAPDDTRAVSDKRAFFDGEGEAQLSEPYTFDVGFENTSQASGGPFLVTGSGIRTTVPTHFQDIEVSDNRCSADGNIIDCDLGSVGPNENVYISITATPTESGASTITVVVRSNEFDPNIANNTVSGVVSVIEPLPGSISGLKWSDNDGDGVFDPNSEPGLADWPVFIDLNGDGSAGADEPSLTTGANGSFFFGDLEAGTYIVCEGSRPGWVQAFPASGCHTVTVEPGQAVEGVNFGNRPAGEIGGRKWHDENADGEQNNGEPPLEGFVFFADLDGSGTLDAGEPSSTSNAEGAYRFSDLMPGTYVVREQPREGWRTVAPASGQYTVELGGNNPLIQEDFNFGNQQYGHIHGIKYHDVNQNRVQDIESGEFGLSGVTVQLLDSEGTVVREQMTHPMDANDDGLFDPGTEMGLFWFENVIPGAYTVREIVPEGITSSSPGGSQTVDLTPGLFVNLSFGNFGYIEDWGDLPDPRFTPTPVACLVPFANLCYATLGPGGPHHLYVAGDPNPLRLGTLIDNETNGQPTADAYGDDNVPPTAVNGVDDEDGITTLTFQNGTTATQGSFEITVSGPPGRTARLDAWIDFDDDGFLANFEQIFNSFAIPIPGGGSVTQTLSFSVPAGFNGGTFARFRLSYVGGLAPYGPVVDGEVEDYVLIGVDYGDARQFDLDGFLPEFPSGYPVNLAANGARHVVTSQVRLGPMADADPNGGDPTILASGDDAFMEDDEDGIVFVDGAVPMTLQFEDTFPDPVGGQPWPFTGFYRDTEVEVIPLASVQGMLNAWIDWNRDGDWDDEGEQIFVNERVSSQEDTLRFRVPADADFGYTYGRFRFNRLGNLSVTGAGADGEVEDYLLAILPPLDFGDASGVYPATAAEMGARHQVGDLRLGATVTADFDAGIPVATQPDADDGVTRPAELLRGADDTSTVHVGGVGNGFLNAWID